MKVTDAYKAMSLRAAELVAQQLADKPNSSLALPTGRTPLGLYEYLAAWSQEKMLDWSKARCFALDEYLDVEERFSFAAYLDRHLYRYTNLPEENRFHPLQCADYDAVISSAGGLDLSIIGIGSNGHIAFNEPGSPRASWTHCTWLTEQTRQANAELFGCVDMVPLRAITMGIETILASRRVVLIASGELKRDILRAALYGPITEAVPASWLQEHPQLEVLTDFSFLPES